MPVGRPSSDPVQQEARVEKARSTARLEGLTPARAKDYKLNVFRTSGGRARGNPVMTLLAGEIEEALGTGADGNELDNLISEKLPEKYPDGTYKCQWYDRNNRPVADPPPWDIDIGDGAEDEDEEDEDMEAPIDVPQPSFPVHSSFAAPAAVPPPAPTLDLAAVGGALREERREEGRRSSEMMTLVVSMQQMSQQNMAAMQQQQQQALQQQQQWQREADERERARRAEARTTMITLVTTMVPIVLPLIQSWMAPKSVGPSPEMSALLELVKGMATNKGSDVMVLEKMMEFQGKMAERQMDIQSKGAGTAVEMQAKATSMVFDNMLNNMKKLMENKPAEEDKEEGTMAMIGKVVGPFLASMAQNQQAPPEMPVEAQQPQRQVAPRQPAQAAPKPQPPVASEAPAAEGAPRRARRRAAGDVEQPRTPIDPSTVPDNKRIEGCLNAVRKASLGTPPPPDRWRLIQWVGNWLPKELLDAVVAQNKDKVLELSATAALGNATILQWITDDDNQTFLKDVLDDVRLLALNQVTGELAEASIIKHGQFIQRRQRQVAQSEQADQNAVARHNNPPEEGEGPKPVVDATVATGKPSAPAPVDGAVAPPGAIVAPPAAAVAPKPVKPPPPAPPAPSTN